MTKIVVTGGAGFIGSHIAEELAWRDYHVIILDDLSTGKIGNIEPLLSKENVEFIQGSIVNLPLLQKLFRGVDYIFHEAAISSVPRSIEKPLISHEVNITGTLNVLMAARDNSVKKLVYASSSSIYGDTPTLPKREDMSPNPQSPYAATKLAGEYYCQVFRKVYGLPTIYLRYFNVYGPRQDPDSQYAAVIPRFITRASQGKPPIILGDGEQTRDFTFVKDVVEANILAAQSNSIGVFNVGRGEKTSINWLAGLTIKLVGNNVEPIHEEPRPGDIRHSLADISRAKEELGYNPRYGLEQALQETISGIRR
ncbi:MAG: SDR family oxidoreductase [Dehalococcoidia bacterium]|nr:SDR family oxidoreductase [Dehalococcoidia bacterium]